jgi:transketolase
MMNNLEQSAINTLRFLSADGVQKANSGHPGLPMGTAAIAYTIWTRHLKFDPTNPAWWDRDRFVLSGGHGSMLLYSLLHLTGFDLPLEELKNFRQWGSRTPGHPEYGLTPGVETTTGPLGQGFANGVGMAIAEAMLAERYNKPDDKLVDHYVYGIVTDGDLMEGVSSEAASLAGHLRLGKIIYCYDDNHISIDGSTELSFTEDRALRFEAYGWQVLRVEDGNDVEAIDKAIKQAKADPRPSLITCRTHIGYGLPTRQDTAKAHGEPPGVEELRAAKINLGWPVEPDFYIPEDVKTFYRNTGRNGHEVALQWESASLEYARLYTEDWNELKQRMDAVFPEKWDEKLPVFPADAKGMATRAASGQVINALAGTFPQLVGGSADLTPSNNTWIKQSSAFQYDNPGGRYLHFGVREHGMGAVVNGLAVHGGFLPYGATFLIFTDYMRAAIRLSALSHFHSIWVMTHDSVGLGEDGPTHQPVEHLAALRAIPNLVVIRPADANETSIAWKAAIERKGGPTLIALTRQAVPTLDRSKYATAEGLLNGAYVLADLGGSEAEILLMASGSEVQLVVAAAERLAEENYCVRVVSFPSWELFNATTPEYQRKVLPEGVRKRVAVEMGVAMGWEKYVGEDGVVLSIEGYGASAPYQTILQEYGFTVENVYQQAKQLLDQKR